MAFTVNPTTGAEEVVIEACTGLADELLSGRQAALPLEHPLLKQHRAEIEETAKRIQRRFGAPQDVEFAVESGTLYVLQSAADHADFLFLRRGRVDERRFSRLAAYRAESARR